MKETRSSLFDELEVRAELFLPGSKQYQVFEAVEAKLKVFEAEVKKNHASSVRL